MGAPSAAGDLRSWILSRKKRAQLVCIATALEFVALIVEAADCVSVHHRADLALPHRAFGDIIRVPNKDLMAGDRLARADEVNPATQTNPAGPPMTLGNVTRARFRMKNFEHAIVLVSAMTAHPVDCTEKTADRS